VRSKAASWTSDEGHGLRAEGRDVHREESSQRGAPVGGEPRSADALLVEQARRGDADAGYRFFREYYPRIYRYLLWLTGRPDAAEDLAQETFVRAWRNLHTFDERAPLRPWLYRIAHREFLRMLRSRKAETSLEVIGDVAAPRALEWAESMELRDAIRKLPVEEGEIVMLHYLEGYDCEEIAQIVRIPTGTVKYRLSEARAHLRRALGEGDLAYLNEQPAMMRQWAWLPLDQMHALEARLVLGSDTRKGEAMERREFLRQTAAGAVGMMLSDTDRDIVDDRLTQKVTLAFKGTALSDVCEHLRAETGVHLGAGPSVADEKVTLFCEKLPLRDVMRQLSRSFGYTWLRSGTLGQHRYELAQDLRSQLLEEELRNRDRNEALLALEREIEKYRPYLDLSPDEVLARAQTAPPAEKKVLEGLGGGHPGLGLAWGITQMYFRLTPQQLAALRAGEELRFSQEPTSGEVPLPPDVARGVLQSLRTWRLLKTRDGYAGAEPDDPRGVSLTAIPEARALVNIKLSHSELGQFGLEGLVGYYGPKVYSRSDDGPYAVGVSPRILEAENAVLNAKFARDPALRRRVSVQPQPSCNLSRVGTPPPPPPRNGEGSDPPSPLRLTMYRSGERSEGEAPALHHRVEAAHSQPQRLHTRLALRGRAGKSSQACDRSDRFPHRLHPSAACLLQHRSFFRAHHRLRRLLRFHPRQLRQPQQPPRYHAVHRQRILQRRRVVDLQPLHPASRLQRIVPPLDHPPAGIIPHHAAGVRLRRSGQGGHQNPLDRLFSGGGCDLGRTDDPHRLGRLRLPCFPMQRRLHLGLRPPQFQLGYPLRLARLARHPHRHPPHHRRTPGHPQQTLALGTSLRRRAIHHHGARPAGSHQQMRVRPPGSRQVGEHVRFAIRHQHHRLVRGQHRFRRLEPLDPLLALFSGGGTLAARVTLPVRCGVARPQRQVQNPQRQLLRRHGQHRVTHQPPREPVTQRAQPGGLFVRGILELGAVLDGQDHVIGATALGGLGVVPRQQTGHGGLRMLKDPMGGLAGRCPAGRREGDFRMLNQPLTDRGQTLATAPVPEASPLHFLLGPSAYHRSHPPERWFGARATLPPQATIHD
jgi:RNA polymerase sigma-70 factor (ECF subfamily)